jgi:CRISPR/Cas system endoribonuclease Cas6 (RAMP superfamily)
MDYHKLQGFVYDKLINTTEFSKIRDSNSYKLFCFPNIFPPHIVKAGEMRNFILASPNHNLIEAVLTQLSLLLNQRTMQ